MGTEDNKNENKEKLSYTKLSDQNNNNNIHTLSDITNNNSSRDNNIINQNDKNDKNYTEIDIDSSNSNNNLPNDNNQNNSLGFFKSLFKSKPKRIIVNGVLIDQRSKEERMAINANSKKFPDKPKHNDIIFSILFFIQIVGFLVLCAIAIKWYPTKLILEFMEQGMVTILISLPLILVFYLIWKRIFQIHPVNMVKTSIFFLLGILVLCIALLIGNEWYAASICTFLFLIYIIFFYIAHRDKIPFAAKVISVTLSVIEKYPSSIATSFITLFLTAIYWNLWILTVGYHMNHGDSSVFYLKFIFLLFNLYWTHYLITYIMYSTISGLFAAWYFFAYEDSSNMPSNPCLSSFIRAITTSFGSIALGSLIVCAISILTFIIRSFARLPGLRLLFNLMANALCCFNRILYTFNIYSFSMVAIYGESYSQSCKKTYSMMVNNPTKLTVAHNFMYFTTLAISISMYFIIAFIVIMIMSALNISEDYFYAQMVMFILLFWKPFDVIFSGVITLVMCLVSESSVMMNNKPTLYSQLNQIYDF